MNSEGFIKLGRRFFRGELWSEERPYSRAEAWLDLVMQARFDTERVTRRVGGVSLVVGRGELAFSLRFLARRWQWSVHRVRRFLDYLAHRGMVETGTGSQGQLMRIAGFEQYSGRPVQYQPFAAPHGVCPHCAGAAVLSYPAGHTSGTPWGTNKEKEEKSKETSLTGGKETPPDLTHTGEAEGDTSKGASARRPSARPATDGADLREAGADLRKAGVSPGHEAAAPADGEPPCVGEAGAAAPPDGEETGCTPVDDLLPTDAPDGADSSHCPPRPLPFAPADPARKSPAPPARNFPCCFLFC